MQSVKRGDDEWPADWTQNAFSIVRPIATVCASMGDDEAVAGLGCGVVCEDLFMRPFDCL
jgi:hypothetical protein